MSQTTPPEGFSLGAPRFQFGVIDKRFLSRSLGLLNPPAPLVIGEASSVRMALELLRKHKIGCLIVTNVEGKIVGMFSERDVVLKVMLSEIDYDRTRISEIMTPSPQTATMTTTVAYALNMMSLGGYRHLPIIDEQAYPVGIVSVKNIVDFLVNAMTKDLTNFPTETP